jgi:acetylornithine deacetylase/succinyl-diaminopimelate desuccinylase-like protein
MQVESLSSALEKEVVSLAMALCAIPSPTGNEMEKAWYVRNWLIAQCGLTPDVDPLGNVIVRIKGSPGNTTQLYVAHIDTVFGSLAVIEPKVEGTRVYAPSIGDNSCNVAALLIALRTFLRSRQVPRQNRIIAFNVGEEGLGNLAGMHALMDRFKKIVGEVISVDANSDAVIDTAVGSVRYRVEVKTCGGHSYSAFGNPNAIRHAANIICRLYELTVPSVPKTTYNVGVIEGGTSVNSIAQSCSFLLDLRSEDINCLETLREQAEALINEERSDEAEINLKLLGERPCGRMIADTRLRDRINAIRRHVGLPIANTSGSTDCNLSLSMGIPSICFGVYRGGGAHTLEEYIEADSVGTGLRQLLYLFFDENPEH